MAKRYGWRAHAEVKKLLAWPEMVLPAGIEGKLKEALLKAQKAQHTYPLPPLLGTSVIWGTKTNSDAMSIAIKGEK